MPASGLIDEQRAGGIPQNVRSTMGVCDGSSYPAQGRPRVARGKTHVGERKRGCGQWGDGAPPVTASSQRKQRPGRWRCV
jgi:hypothetical protein